MAYPVPAPSLSGNGVGATDRRLVRRPRVAAGRPPSYPRPVLKLVLIGGLAAAAWFGFQAVRDADPDRLPQPTQVVVPNPPDVSFNVPTP